MRDCDRKCVYLNFGSQIKLTRIYVLFQSKNTAVKKFFHQTYLDVMITMERVLFFSFFLRGKGYLTRFSQRENCPLIIHRFFFLLLFSHCTAEKKLPFLPLFTVTSFFSSFSIKRRFCVFGLARIRSLRFYWSW